MSHFDTILHRGILEGLLCFQRQQKTLEDQGLYIAQRLLGVQIVISDLFKDDEKSKLKPTLAYID